MEDDFEKKYELLKFVTDLAEKESDRGWKRYTVMLSANAGLLAFLAISIRIQNEYVVLFLAFMAVVISWSWIKITESSYYYEHRWHADMEAIIKSDPYLSKWVRGRNNPRIDRPHNKSGLYLFEILPIFMTLFWLLVGALSGLHAFLDWRVFW